MPRQKVRYRGTIASGPWGKITKGRRGLQGNGWYAALESQYVCIFDYHKVSTLEKICGRLHLYTNRRFKNLTKVQINNENLT